MKFEEVLPALKEGKKIGRKKWNKGYYYEMTYKYGHNVIVDNYGEAKEDWENILATDWEIVKETKKVKLKDLTEKEFLNWKNEKCEADCEHCIFENVECAEGRNNCWVRNKDIYSDKFLDQEIEIEVSELLTKKEKEYLEDVIRPFKDKVKDIVKVRGQITLKEFIYIQLVTDETINLPYFERNKYYKKLELSKHYTIEELGLYKNKKITLSEFWNSDKDIAIHCDTEEKANKLLKAFDKLGKKWRNGDSYLKYNFYETYKEKICYSNWNTYDSLGYYKEENVIIYEFEDVDLEN